MSRVYELPTAERLHVAALVPPVARLLDVGCNEGAFGRVIAQRGTEVSGIEPNEVAAGKAAAHLHKVICGRYPDDFPEGETFDCIVFNDVLEHMPEPDVALHAARRQLTPSGCLIASIPNIRHISVVSPLVGSGRWDYQDWGILDRTHLRFFTKATMREMFENAGYRVDLQQPDFWTKPKGKWQLLRFLGKAGEEFEAVQYLMVAHPV